MYMPTYEEVTCMHEHRCSHRRTEHCVHAHAGTYTHADNRRLSQFDRVRIGSERPVKRANKLMQMRCANVICV
jgi:hypothetical protein